MNLVKLRVTHGLSQYDLASITGIAQPNIASMERGQRPLTQEMWDRINTELQTWLAVREEAAERAVQSAFNKPHLVAMRAKSEQDSL